MVLYIFIYVYFYLQIVDSDIYCFKTLELFETLIPKK